MFRLNPVTSYLNIQVANLTKHDLNVSSRLEGTQLRITITGPRHGTIIAPDDGLVIATQVAGEKTYGA